MKEIRHTTSAWSTGLECSAVVCSAINRHISMTASDALTCCFSLPCSFWRIIGITWRWIWLTMNITLSSCIVTRHKIKRTYLFKEVGTYQNIFLFSIQTLKQHKIYKHKLSQNNFLTLTKHFIHNTVGQYWKQNASTWIVPKEENEWNERIHEWMNALRYIITICYVVRKTFDIKHADQSKYFKGICLIY